MNKISEFQVKKDNSNIRWYSDSLWRALRKERFKPARPDAIVNQMAAEQLKLQTDTHFDFTYDINKFIDEKMSMREASVIRMFLFGGGMTQEEIAAHLGVSQSTVNNTLKSVLTLIKEEFHGYF